LIAYGPIRGVNTFLEKPFKVEVRSIHRLPILKFLKGGVTTCADKVDLYFYRFCIIMKSLFILILNSKKIISDGYYSANINAREINSQDNYYILKKHISKDLRK
jgi:hypothetical protein